MGHETKEFDYNVVVLGGGTGPYNLLLGLADHNTPSKITAMPTMWDSGGNTGYLRVEKGVLPQGDARRQLIALTPDPAKREILRNMWQHRISLGGERHAVGNLELAALGELYPGKGIDMARALYDVESRIISPSTTPLDLWYKVREKEYQAEHFLDERAQEAKRDPSSKINRIYFSKPAEANPAAVEALEKADKIIFSAGSLFGSVLPHLLIPGIRNAINKSQAELYFVLNVMTEPGQTDGFKASNHIFWFNRLIKNPNRLNYLIAHDNHISKTVLEEYAEEGQFPVEIDEEECRRLAPNLRVVKGQFATYLEEEQMIRHDPDAIALVHLDTPRYLTQAA